MPFLYYFLLDDKIEPIMQIKNTGLRMIIERVSLIIIIVAVYAISHNAIKIIFLFMFLII